MATSKKRAFGTVPTDAKQQPQPFELHIEEQKLQDLKTLLRLSPVAKQTYENSLEDGRFGVSRKWMLDTKKFWEEEYDWRKEEARINSLPNFKTQIIDDDGFEFDIHFVALFSKKEDAIPISFFHGWPGSFLEFLPILDLLRNKFSPEDLPYHIIAPSLPGYTLSSQPPLDRDWRVEDSARIMHKLLLSLGFGESGYIVQGGDIGSMIARTIAATYPECKAMHLNFMFMLHPPGPEISSKQLSQQEQRGLQRMNEFNATGNAYGRMHGTRPSTIGHVLSSSPLALLAWIGEKFLAWSDPSTTPSISTILSDVTLYWLTESFPSSIYTYRQDFTSRSEHYFHGQEKLFVSKPVGYSYFPYELMPIPKAWAERTGNLVWFRAHEKGGHFAALECGEELWKDVEAFVMEAKKQL